MHVCIYSQTVLGKGVPREPVKSSKACYSKATTMKQNTKQTLRTITKRFLRDAHVHAVVACYILYDSRCVASRSHDLDQTAAGE